ncbi:MAG: hypothetical protein ACRDDY_02600 [Clostridium sp.]|uniref:hypothetical protein n=1 Tax=Clostridium TaxID=1485 RepID=UPI003EE7EE42
MIRYEDNTNKFKQELKRKRGLILYAIGLKFQALCTKIITRNGIVDTGRLRSSITFYTKDKVGAPLKSTKNSRSSDYLTGSASENELIVGSGVEYALKQELESKKGAFIKPALLEYRDTYRRIAENILKE